MTPLERDVERALVSAVKRHGGLCLKWVCPGWAGVPDRIILLPRGRIKFVELKRPKGGKVAPLQAWWAEQLTRLGFEHYYLFTTEAVADLAKIIQAEDKEEKTRKGLTV